MAKVISIGEPVNDAERQAIAYLRDHTPDSFILIHTFEIERQGELYEVDMALLAPHAVYLIDAKGTQGEIVCRDGYWHPRGRTAFRSPLPKLRGHAKVLKGLLANDARQSPALNEVYVDAVVLLTASDASFQDGGGRDASNVTTFATAKKFFSDKSRIATRFTQKSIMPLHTSIQRALQAKSRKPSGPMAYRDWEVTETLVVEDGRGVYRAINRMAGKAAGTVQLTVTKTDPYQDTRSREAQRARIANAFTALSALPSHPNIQAVRDFFAAEDDASYVLVTSDIQGNSLRLHIDKAELALTLDQKRAITRQLLSGLAHAHLHQVIHRNLSPSTVMLGQGGTVHITGFDYARLGQDRSMTVADELETMASRYAAPEVALAPEFSSSASDIFSAGLLLYELYVGETAFADQTSMADANALFSVVPSEVIDTLDEHFDRWLQALCAEKQKDRPDARSALSAFDALFTKLTMAVKEESKDIRPKPATVEDPTTLDYNHLAPGTPLAGKFVVQRPLGRPGSFGIVYQVTDTLGDVTRAMKLILRDRHSTIDRLKVEYKTLLQIPRHPHVVKVIDANVLAGDETPYIVFEYIDGQDVGEMIEASLISLEDAVDLGKQVADGLAHLHKNGVQHCDIKPRNLLWTSQGARIIDFNVAKSESSEGLGGGSERYLPPDLDKGSVATQQDREDRDVYALGITLYEAICGRYPWQSSTPPAGQEAPDPREILGLEDISSELVEFLLTATAPRRSERFVSAAGLLDALSELKQLRRKASVDPSATQADLTHDHDPNRNPYVRQLLRLYSQSQVSNAGTRGLDKLGEQIYVDTLLDQELAPAVLGGKHRLVVITGNAGDGKTAFLQKLESTAALQGASLDHSGGNGCQFELNGRHFISNYDGSQDEGDVQNDVVLQRFFEPFQGDETSAWRDDETRLIAINEGRLIDFFEGASTDYSALHAIIEQGLQSGVSESDVAVVNLNLRSVVAPTEDGSILQRLLNRMTHPALWTECEECSLKNQCYARHNALSFQDPTAGPKLVDRLEKLYTLTHLRGRMHITLRDLGSALAYMLVGTRDCAQIHELYSTGQRNEIVQSFYFNSWMGGDEPNADRLLQLLKEVDVGHSNQPILDRQLDFVSPLEDKSLFSFDARRRTDVELLRTLHETLPREVNSASSGQLFKQHRRYVAMNRRRVFFETRDSRWKALIPYQAGESMMRLVAGEDATAQLLPSLLVAINRGEGLSAPERIGGNLALQVREVPNGSVRSYRLFNAELFALKVQDRGGDAAYIEHMPDSLILSYHPGGGHSAELVINLDVLELLDRLNRGYRPSTEEKQGFLLNLTVFKNVLGSAPYQDVLLTTTGHDFSRIRRHPDGRLQLERLAELNASEALD